MRPGRSVWWWGAVLGLGLCAGCGPRAPSVLLVSLDTTRADHLGAYGYARDVTPRLDALAARGLVFENAVTTSHNTLVAHASLFTGLFPGAHGATHEGDGVPLAPAYRTLAEDFADAGWATAGFAAHKTWLSREFGMDQGFGTFGTGWGDADTVIAAAEAWLSDLSAADPRRPFFLFVHLFDAHSDWKGRPYAAPPPFRGRYTADYRGPLRWPDPRWPEGSRFLQAASEGGVDLDAADVQHLVDQYDEGLAHLDDRVGAFVERVRAARPGTWVVVTADHGEAFEEHGAFLHATLHEEVVRVPLLLIPPDDRRRDVGAPRRIPEQVRLVDLRPTLLALAGIEPGGSVQGASLWRWLSSGRPARPAAAGAAPIAGRALRADGWKLLVAPDGERLYDLRAGEQRDLARDPDHAERAAAMRRALEAFRSLDATVRARHGDGPAAPDLAPEARERLRALGYGG